MVRNDSTKLEIIFTSFVAGIQTDNEGGSMVLQETQLDGRKNPVHLHSPSDLSEKKPWS